MVGLPDLHHRRIDVDLNGREVAFAEHEIATVAPGMSTRTFSSAAAMPIR